MQSHELSMQRMITIPNFMWEIDILNMVNSTPGLIDFSSKIPLGKDVAPEKLS